MQWFSQGKSDFCGKSRTHAGGPGGRHLEFKTLQYILINHGHIKYVHAIILVFLATTLAVIGFEGPLL